MAAYMTSELRVITFYARLLVSGEDCLVANRPAIGRARIDLQQVRGLAQSVALIVQVDGVGGAGLVLDA